MRYSTARQSICGLVAVVTIIATSLLTGSARADSARTCEHPSKESTAVGSLARDRHPLVLVHGWIGDAGGMADTWKAIDAAIPNTFQARFFDYRNANTEWAASPTVASCLASYLHQVARAHRDRGGDGRVFVVAHSMGGLAARFATSSLYTDQPASDVLAGLTTIDTPHLGSPFGNTVEGDFWQWQNELGNANLLPDRASDAVRCLALHGKDRVLPAGCAAPPYLPTGVALGQISGDNLIRRTLFGIDLYDIDLRSDGIVGVDSASGYLLQSGPPNKSVASEVAYDSIKDVSCTVTTDQTMALLRAFRGGNIPAAIISAELQAIGFLANDSAILDQILSGQPGPNLMAMMLVAALVYPCSHNGMLTEASSIAALVASLRTQLKSSAAQPIITTLRPFDRNGNLAQGWILDKRTNGPIDCDYSSPSRSAVEDNLQECGPTPASADSCLVLPPGTTALCLSDPFSTTVVRNAVSGHASTTSTAPKSAVPIALVLDDGTQCRLRIGGSWPTPQAKPDYIGYYGCSLGSTFQAVWGPQGGDGITQSPDGWTVQLGGERGALSTHRVSEVRYVGFA